MPISACETLDLPRSLLVILRMEAEMRRDDDYIRELMLELEACDEWVIFFQLLDDSDAVATRRYYHLRLLADAGFLEETGRHSGNFRITNSGHDFLGLIRDDTIWGKTRHAVSHLGGASLQMLSTVAEAYLRQGLAKLGVPL